MPHPQLDNLVRSGELKEELAEQLELDGLVAPTAKRLRVAAIVPERIQRLGSVGAGA